MEEQLQQKIDARIFEGAIEDLHAQIDDASKSEHLAALMDEKVDKNSFDDALSILQGRIDELHNRPYETQF